MAIYLYQNYSDVSVEFQRKYFLKIYVKYIDIACIIVVKFICTKHDEIIFIALIQYANLYHIPLV